MCGLIAAFSAVPLAETALQRGLQRMLRRGQDGEGLWQEPGAQLAHRRLAILDLDPRGVQPMHSACGRYVIVFNGEIYNFAELRRQREIAGDTFRTRCDTEVILAMFAAEGEAMVPKLRGMFAFVIWDRVARRAFAARDPYGIKPLYYAAAANRVVFASQVKALLATGEVSREPDPQGEAAFWLLGSVPEPHTWYRDIRALPAGHCAWVEPEREITLRSYWDISAAWRAAEFAPRPRSEDVYECVGTALRSSVADHLVSDVPVGVFLSGGIDSGALAGLMLDAGARDLEGITLSYDEFAGSDRDEVPLAMEIAAHYGIRHHVRRVTQEEFVADLPRILEAMDQPSIDGINTWYASKAAAERGLKVVVSGVGGDELFQGYASFRQLPRLVSHWRVASRIPGALAAARLAGRIQARRSHDGRWRHAADWARTLPGAWWLRRSLYSPDDLAGLMGAERAAAALRDFRAETRTQGMSGALPRDARLALGQIESTTYLRNQLLRDSDWASMDHGVELRTPLVDAWLLKEVEPVLAAFVRFPHKELLASAPATRLPNAVITRPKTGFGIPVQQWTRRNGPLSPIERGSRGWARELARTYDAGTTGI